MPIEKLAEKFEEIFAKTGSITRAEQATKAMYSGSATDENYASVNAKDIYYTVVELKEKLDVALTKTNTLDASIDGGTF